MIAHRAVTVGIGAIVAGLLAGCVYQPTPAYSYYPVPCAPSAAGSAAQASQPAVATGSGGSLPTANGCFAVVQNYAYDGYYGAYPYTDAYPYPYNGYPYPYGEYWNPAWNDWGGFWGGGFYRGFYGRGMYGRGFYGRGVRGAGFRGGGGHGGMAADRLTHLQLT